MIAKKYGASLYGDETVLKLVLKVAQLCECTKYH